MTAAATPADTPAEDVAIRLERLTKTYPGASRPAVVGARSHDPPGRTGGAGRAVGLWQDHHAQDDQPPHRAHRRHGVGGRCRHPHPADPRASPRDRLRHSAGWALPPSHGRRQHRHRPQAAGLGSRPHQGPGGRAGRSAASRPGTARPLSLGACRADNSSGWASPERWPPIRRCCSWTSPTRPSTPSCGRSSRTSSSRSSARSTRRLCSSLTTSTRPSSSPTGSPS